MQLYLLSPPLLSATETSPSKHPPGAGAAGGGGGAGSILSAINLSSNPGGGGGVTPRTDGESSAAKSSPSPLEKVNLAGVCKSLAKVMQRLIDHSTILALVRKMTSPQSTPHHPRSVSNFLG